MSDTKLTQDDVHEILRLIQSADHVAEFHLRYGDVEIGLSRANGDARGPAPAAAHAAPPPAPTVPQPPAATTPRAPAAPAPGAAARAADVPAGMMAVKSPMVGTFYRSPAPGAPSFVEVGSKVEPQTTVCIIEVMKLMNSISAGMRGTVREVRVSDAEPVEFGQVLIVIEPER
jgi:acetyl-CoA carboxylase biotin carboxyl carrier protein